MRAPRSNSPLFTLGVVLTVATAIILFSSTPVVQAQEMATPTPEVQGQIVGGALADPGEYPWQVELIIGPYLCGGSLIHPQWVLTAAHCVTEDDGSVSAPGTVDVYAGEYDRTGVNGYVYRGAIQIIRHPSYDSYTYDSDIALIKLNAPLAIGEGANPPYTRIAVIPLVPSTIGSLAGTNAWATGWGDTSYGGNTSAQLREVQLPIISNSACNTSNRWGDQITNNMLCAGSDAGTQSTCQGDSGGPLVVWNSGTGQWNLAGVTSFGPIGCAVPYAPSVFARVSQFGSWVNTNIGPVTQIGPSGAQGTNYTPTYSWTAVGTMTYYDLYVNGPAGTKVFEQWYTAAQLGCGSGGTCTATPSTPLGGGSHQWWVQTWNPAGLGAWSTGMSFSTTIPPLPGMAALLTPSGNIGTNYNPSYTWNQVTDSTYYELYIQGPSGQLLDQWYLSSTICSSGTCTVTNPLTLAGGNHSWWVRTWNSTGFGNWSLRKDFNTFIETPPPAVTAFNAPLGFINTNYTPNFVWTAIGNATYYELYIQGPSGLVLDTWYLGSSICSSGTCTVTNPATLGGGNHSWWVRTYNSAGLGGWSAGQAFSTFVETPPVAVTAFTAPLGNITPNYSPNFVWTAIGNATYYELYVQGPSGQLLDQWYQSSAICSSGTCTVAAPLTLGSGNHSWWIRTFNSAGLGGWSAGQAFSTDPLGAATLVSPTGSGGSNPPVYTWNKATGAAYYYVYVSTASGTKVFDQWYQASVVCVGSTCTVTQPSSLANGSYNWWVQTYNPTGYGPWSSTTGLAFSIP